MTQQIGDELRKAALRQVNSNPGTRESLEEEHGQVWTTDELQRDFEVLQFLAPYVVVRRKSDGICGSLMFQHSPRFYFSFQEE